MAIATGLIKPREKNAKILLLSLLLDQHVLPDILHAKNDVRGMAVGCGGCTGDRSGNGSALSQWLAHDLHQKQR